MNELDAKFAPMVKTVASVLYGKEESITLALAAFFAKGHLLVEDIPGVGKTTLAKALASLLGLEFNRIQFTSDLLPSDILGVNYFNQKQSEFVFKKGPIFTQFLLADEINRSMPKTQSALLEAMEESSITIDGEHYELQQPFFVMGTQNPYEEVGTFKLPDSQLDRFICAMSIGYPAREAERDILAHNKPKTISQDTTISLAQIKEIQEAVSKVYMSEALLDYMQEIIALSRNGVYFTHGLSTRGALALAQMTRSWAYLHGREYAIPDDVTAVAPYVCLHRLHFKEGKTTIERIKDVITSNTQPDA
ncbi:MoxR family ATPase [Sulfurovum sp. zt1-1]|uniref:MoxR family ATPase n=1 Tax=Sulfurovum zhangzhouensis TaxID=3019067 RepID=A0ABT7QZZ6_9BACT|nr:MoxR family ATPase [Sulfurovum zhangzhouensis]MDM5272414.1 MoxR family ATPase [Sulfurovum zhangzhouensis]